MSKYLFGDLVHEVKEKVDRQNNPYEFFIAGDHMDTDELHLLRRGTFAGSDVGPAFIRVFKPGQVLYGSRRTYLRKVAVADFEGVTANTTFVLETKNESILIQQLLPFIMQSERFVQHSIKRSKGSTNPYVLFSDLCDYEIDLPNIETQKRLAEVLWTMDEVRMAYKKLIAATDELVKSQFLGEFGDPVANPMHWKTTPLLEMGKCKNGMNFSTKDSGFDISCLGVADFQSRLTIHGDTPLTTISLNEMPGEDYLLKNGDIVFVRSNGNKELVGRSVLVKFTDRITTFSGFCIRFRKEANYLNEIYLLHLLRIDSVRKKLRGRGANVQNLSQQTLANIDVPLPPIHLQEQFAAFVHQSDKSKFELEQALSELTATYKRIISEQLG